MTNARLLYKPCCKNPLLLVNKYCITMLQNGAKLFLSNKEVFVQFPNNLPLKVWLEQARDGIIDVESSFVQLGDIVENFFFYAPCNNCELCRHSKQVDLINRAQLESLQYDCPPFFFTLTYNDSNLPKDAYGRTTYELRYKDFQDFMKRLRINWTRRGIKHDVRVLVAGEYGHKYGRPHYHVVLWNNPYHCNEFQPHLVEQLKVDIFTAWNKCDWKVFNKPENFGQCRDGAAGYVTKYVTKPCNMRGHYIKPFIHCSAGKRGGLGAPFIDSQIHSLHLSPSQNYLEYVDKQGNYKFMYFSKSLSRRIWKSPSASVPASIKQAYRELVRVVELLYSIGVDYREYLELLRPSEHVLNTFKMPENRHCCPTLKYITYVSLDKVFSTLADFLCAKYDVDNVYIHDYYLHKSFFTTQNSEDYAIKVSKIRQKLAVVFDKTTF